MARFIRHKEVLRITGWSASTIARKEKLGLFPQRYRLGRNAAWLDEEVDQWIRSQRRCPRFNAVDGGNYAN